jgi:Helix-turn-helix domain
VNDEEQHEPERVKRFLTTRELAAVLRLQPQSIARWRREHKGRLFVRVRGHCLYEADEVERFLRLRMERGEQ